MSWRDWFRFGERAQATVVDSLGPPAPSPRRPPRGTAILVVESDEGEALALGTVAAPPAPRGSLYVGDVPSTFVVHGDDRAQQEFAVSVDAELPFEVPASLRATPGAARLRVSWSCEHAE